MQLYDKCLLDIDDDINDYLPFDIRNPNYPNVNITIRMLLSHQSSIYDYFIHDPNGTSEVQRFFPFPEDTGQWIQNILIPGGELYLNNYWMECAPGEHVRYCSIGYIILGYILELVTGLEYETYVKENIFVPLGMNNSGFYKENFDRDQIATPYIFYGNNSGINIPLPHIAMNFFNPMGGMFTSLNDLSRFFIAHMNNGVYNGVRILNESTVDEMHTIQHPEIDVFLWNLNYGLGWMFANEFICKTEGHGGIFLGFFSNMMYNPANKTGILFLANTNIKSFKESKFDEMFVWAYKTVGNLLLERAAHL
jgi:CubicO group peptidase (beta-lactamase class C family)